MNKKIKSDCTHKIPFNCKDCGKKFFFQITDGESKLIAEMYLCPKCLKQYNKKDLKEVIL